MKTLLFFILGFTTMSLSASDTDEFVSKAKQFIEQHEAQIRPLEKTASLAWWDANISGSEEEFKKKEEAQNKLDEKLSDPKTFQKLKAIREGLKAEKPDALLKRSIDILYLQYLEKQVAPELLKKMVAKGNLIEKNFNTFRATIDGKEMPDSEVRKVLKESTDSALREKVWLASKNVGPVLEKDFLELVKLRNEAAKTLGFDNFHAMQLELNEQTQKDVLQLFDELDQLTRKPFLTAKAEIDAKLAAKYKLKAAQLKPWHYNDPYFQESPAVFDADLDGLYKNADILKLCRDFYKGIGLSIDDVIERSDLYEKKGKSPHAFCTDIDREGDVRVLGNIVPNEYWMGTMLHELGHSVYSSKNIPKSLPYVLRTEAHILSTEGIAMMFGALSKNMVWSKSMGLKVPHEKETAKLAHKIRRNELLIFSRWVQVMLRFEKALYENPEQDLNKLWWDLVENYQGLHRPTGRNAPDYASKIHVVSAPAYYHNYMMGELFAAQLHATIAKTVLKQKPRDAVYVGHKEVGEFLTKKVFGPGRSLDWNALTEFATGSKLNAKAFSEAFKQ